MSDYIYPKIQFKDVYPILSLMIDIKKNPDILKKSPYDKTVKKAFSELLINTNQVSEKKLEDVDMEKETVYLYESTKSIALDVGDPREKIALVKLQATILKDLLDMLKESKEIKEIKKFEEMVYGLLTQEQKDFIVNNF